MKRFFFVLAVCAGLLGLGGGIAFSQDSVIDQAMEQASKDENQTPEEKAKELERKLKAKKAAEYLSSEALQDESIEAARSAVEDKLTVEYPN